LKDSLVFRTIPDCGKKLKTFLKKLKVFQEKLLLFFEKFLIFLKSVFVFDGGFHSAMTV